MKIELKNSLKTKFFFLVLITIFQSCSGKQDDNDWTKENLKDKVKSYSEIHYEAFEEFGEIKKRKKLYGFNYDFDLSGNLIVKEYLNSDGSLNSKDITKYDDLGNKIDWSFYDTNGTLYSKFIYSYDSNKNLIQDNNLDRYGDIELKRIYKYDDLGNLIVIDKYDVTGKMFSKELIKYDSNGNEIEVNSYGSNGGLTSKLSTEYDENENKINVSQFEKNGLIRFKSVYKYNKKGNKLEELKIEYDNYGALVNKNVTQFNDQGDIFETNSYDFLGNLKDNFIQKYEYDKKGNWVKCTLFKNKQVKSIYERNYEYYD